MLAEVFPAGPEGRTKTARGGEERKGNTIKEGELSGGGELLISFSRGIKEETQRGGST